MLYALDVVSYLPVVGLCGLLVVLVGLAHHNNIISSPNMKILLNITST